MRKPVTFECCTAQESARSGYDQGQGSSKHTCVNLANRLMVPSRKKQNAHCGEKHFAIVLKLIVTSKMLTHKKCHEQVRGQDFLRKGAIQRGSRRTKRAPEALASRGMRWYASPGNFENMHFERF